MYCFVNQKIIDGKVYTIKRDSVNPKDEIMECDDRVDKKGKKIKKLKKVNIKSTWNSQDKIKKLWQS
jgi:hypothetical protein